VSPLGDKPSVAARRQRPPVAPKPVAFSSEMNPIPLFGLTSTKYGKSGNHSSWKQNIELKDTSQQSPVNTGDQQLSPKESKETNFQNKTSHIRDYSKVSEIQVYLYEMMLCLDFHGA